MGKQSSRLIYRGKDIKDLYYMGKRLFKMYKGNQLVWEKLIGDEYLIFYGTYTNMGILDMDEKEAYKAITSRNWANNGEGLYLIADYGDYVADLLFTDDGINYTHLADARGLPIGTNTILNASKNGAYLSAPTDGDWLTGYRYRVFSYLKNESGQVIKNEDFFDSEGIRRFISLSTLNYKSDIIPFGYDATNGVYYFAKGNEVIENGFIVLYNEYATKVNAVAFVCVESTFHIIHASYYEGHSCYDSTHFNFEENKCWINRDVFRIDKNSSSVKKVIYQNGKLYLYFYLNKDIDDMKEGLYCYESPDFANFKRTKCDEENYYRDVSYPYYSGIGDVFYLENEKIPKKDCMIMSTTTGPLYIDNMYFNKTDGCFGFTVG